jgi:DUF1680 family protein
VINLYNACSATASTASGKPVQIDIETVFPLDGNISIVLKPRSPEEFTLRLRIPEWSEETILKVNGVLTPVTPGTYAAIRRRWSQGDRIELSLDMRCRLLDAPHGSNRLGDHFHALVRGPIVLARDENLDEHFDEPVSIVSGNGIVDIIPEEPTIPGTRMQFRVPTSKGFIRMVDYASVNSWQGKHICTWLPNAD